jgi:hypothetical protein
MESVTAEPTNTALPGTMERHVARTARWALRTVITVQTLDLFAQAMLAGHFLNGSYGSLRLHSTNGTIIGIIGIAQMVAALLYWRPGGGAGWPTLASLGLFITEALQIALGHSRVIAVHVPLGVAIVAAMTLMTAWAWRPTFRQRRPTAVRGAE